MNSIAAIVVTYNRKKLLQECLDNLIMSDENFDILLVDNNSTDGTNELVEDNYKNKVIYYNTGKNIGGAGGFHFGLRKAYELGYQYFWLMDDDTIVEPNSLTKLLKCDELLKGEYGFLSSQAKWVDGTRCVMNYHQVAADWEDKSELLENRILKISMATFVSFFTRREVVKEVGLPIKEYFIWGDDTEYSGRISRKYNSYYCFDSVVVHKMSKNESSEAFSDMDDIARIQRMKLSIRNDLCTAKRIGKKEMLKCIYGKIKMVVKCLTMKRCVYRWHKIQMLIFGIWQGLFFDPTIEMVE